MRYAPALYGRGAWVVHRLCDMGGVDIAIHENVALQLPLLACVRIAPNAGGWVRKHSVSAFVMVKHTKSHLRIGSFHDWRNTNTGR